MDSNEKGSARDVIDTVQVALRIRPLVDSEIARGCEECIEVVPGEPQVQIKDLAFTYNYVFPPHIGQQEFYDTAVKNLIGKLFQGYNVTILAYGQTGSGKTYSMGTNYSGCEGDSNNLGVIPQAVGDIFDFVEYHEQDFIFKVSVSFMELYQEQCYDLLSEKPRAHSVVEIREDHRGVILPGLTEKEVCSSAETMTCLTRGSEGRAVGATAMNEASSRSHAVFTIYISKESRKDKNQATTSKFHLVDLAGSERTKKTKATGDRLKEGIKINQGLLALGNVISALGDGTNRGYICYRESKLTRLLQDSLGGNSLTMMVACVSPADYNLEETVSTLRYADRARKIRNKPVVNQDAKAAEIVRLNSLVNELRLQLLSNGPIRSNDSDLAAELEKEKLKYSDLLQKHRHLTDILNNLLNDNTNLCEKALVAEAAKEKIERKLNELTEQCNQTIENMNLSMEKSQDDVPDRHKSVMEYLKDMKNKLEDLQSVQVKCNEQLMEHDIRGTSNTDIKDENDNESLPDLQTDEDQVVFQQEAHAMDQVALNKELQDLNQAMAIKASVVKQMLKNTQDMVDFDQNLKENEAKVASLEKEKNELMQQLKNAQNKMKDPLTEERRKKVTALEHEIQGLKKKCQDQARVIQLKERNEAKINALNNEIQTMKMVKVNLIKRMRTESEKFRRWKAESERDVLRLKNADRKRANAMAKMENMHAKQQNVLKRKMEEAVAINKRLKEALDRQKISQAKRSKSNKTEALHQWVEQELEIQLSTVDAVKSLDELMEDRGLIVAEIERLRSEDSTANENKIAELENDLALRKAQISDLQQKILSVDQENKTRTRWDNVQSMLEAKQALRYLFEALVETKRELQNFGDRGNHQAKYQRLKETHDVLQNEYQRSKREWERQMAVMEMQHEQKLSAIMAVGRGVKVTGDGTDACKQLQQHIEVQEKRLASLEEENEKLTKELESLKNISRKPKKINKNVERLKVEDVLPTDEEDDDDDDPDKDPEWRATPIYKRLQASRPRLTMNFTAMESQDGSRPSSAVSVKGTKRGSDGAPHCACRGSCSTRLCSCRKAETGCGSSCKCPSVLCKNRRTSSDSDEKENTTPIEKVPSENATIEIDNRGPHDMTFIKKKKYYFYPDLQKKTHATGSD